MALATFKSGPKKNHSLIKKKLFINLLNHPPGKQGGVEHEMKIGIAVSFYHIVIVEALTHPFAVYLPDLPYGKPLPIPCLKPVGCDVMPQCGAAESADNIQNIDGWIFFVFHVNLLKGRLFYTYITHISNSF